MQNTAKSQVCINDDPVKFRERKFSDLTGQDMVFPPAGLLKNDGK